MVRLLRLASVDDCIFRTSFGNDITVEPGSKLAVLNATFETMISEISVSSGNNSVRFLADIGAGLSEINTNFNIAPRTYSGQLGITEFWRDFNQAVNGTLLYGQATGAGAVLKDAGVFSEFEIAYDDYAEEFPTPLTPVELTYTFSPLLSAMGATWSMAYPQGSRNAPLLLDPNSLFDWSGTPVATDAERFANILKQVSGAGPTAGTKVRTQAAEGIVMSKGSGLWMARVKNLVDNGGGAGLQNNGFGIGLSQDLELVDDAVDIPSAKIFAQVRVNRPGEPYSFIIGAAGAGGAGTEQQSAINPRRYDANDPLTDHDVMWIRVGVNERADQATANDPTYGRYCVQGGVWQDGGASGVEHIFFSYELPAFHLQYDFLHPYLFINGTDLTCEVDAIAFTPSVTHLMNTFNLNYDEVGLVFTPAQIGDSSPTLGKNEYKITNIIKNGLGTAYPASVMGNVLPQISATRFDDQETRTTKLELHADIWRYLGYGRSFKGYDFVLQKMGMANLQFENLIQWIGDGGPDLDDDDNFIVESMTLPVDSYDASEQFYGDGNPALAIGLNRVAERKGRRKNILATIPATNLGSITQYEASTPQFIDLRNKSTLNERNLEFRILDKNFNPVETGSSKSILTLLLAGPGEK